MDVVLDTNVLIVAISSRSKYRPIFDSFLKEEITLCATSDILIEYEEIIGRYLGKQLATNILQIIENAPNVRWITRYYKWNLIKDDPDDNKFVDCAIASNARFLVSNDKHFQVLSNIEFPSVNLVDAKAFLEELNHKQSP
ncbi:MAG: putative toxin-antitoxin system toxin component, PIN family [Bacteroidota bacterium]